MKIQELVYNRSNLIRSQVGFVSTFGCMLQFRIFLFSFFQLMCVFISVLAKSETEQCQCAFMYHSSARKKESAIIMCVFSLVLAFVSVYILVCTYVCSCMCMCLPGGAYLCHCQYVQAGSVGQLCACV